MNELISFDKRDLTRIPIILMLFLSIATSVIAENFNQIKNASFEFTVNSENTAVNIPVYWSKAFSGSMTYFGITKEQKYQGDYSLYINDFSSEQNGGIWTEPIKVTPGYTYTARAWGRYNSNTVNGLMYLRFYSSDSTLLSNTSIGVGSTDGWTLGIKTVTAPKNAAYARILLYTTKASIGIAYFDCISLTLGDEMVSDGTFNNATVNTLPNTWSILETNSTLQSQEIHEEDDNKFLRIADELTISPSGAYTIVPAFPNTPYKFNVSTRKVDGDGPAYIYLKFYSADSTQLTSYAMSTNSVTFVPLTINKVAPEGTAYAKLICYISISGKGTADFDDISFTENYTNFYAAPSALGNGSGESENNAAQYNSSTFWNLVNSSALNHPVKVELLDGHYTEHWDLTGVGNSTNKIIITGKNPFGMQYVKTNSNLYYLAINNCNNIVFKHLHFTAAENANSLIAEDHAIYDYEIVMRIGTDDTTNSNHRIQCVGITFTDMLLMRYSAVSNRGFNTSDISWNNCSFTRIGWDKLDHSIYSTHGASVTVENCYFQDCNGVYVLFRNRSIGSVKNCKFIATGTQPSGNSPLYYVNHSFIQLTAFNVPKEGYVPDEFIGNDYNFSNNHFEYNETRDTKGFRCPFSITVQGIAPISHPNYHNVSKEDGAILKDTSASNHIRDSLVQYYFGIDLINNCKITNNTYVGCWDTKFPLCTMPFDKSYWYQQLSNPEQFNCNVNKLVGIIDKSQIIDTLHNTIE